jgi:hypothetical protein
MIRSQIITPAVALAVLAVLLFCPVVLGQSIPDPGNPTTITFQGTGLYVGESHPITAFLYNDEAIEAIMLRLSVRAPDTDFVSDPDDYVRFDSVTYFPDPLGIDPLMLDWREVAYSGNQSWDGADTLDLIMACSNPPHVPIPEGLCPIVVKFWFTGVAPGWIHIDLLGNDQAKLFPEGTPFGPSGYFYPSVYFPEHFTIFADTPPGPSCGDRGTTDVFAVTNVHEAYPVGESTPIPISLFNDEPIASFSVMLRLHSADSGTVYYDSVRFVGRFADPNVCDIRMLFDGARWVDGTLPDSIGLICSSSSGGQLVEGNGPLFEIFVSGVTKGQVTVSGDGDILAACTDGIARYPRFDVACVPGTITVEDPVDLAPVFQPLANPDPVITGEMVSFEVQASSPIGNPVEVALESLYLYDSLYGESVSQPIFSDGLFTWAPDPDDVGIWKATFVATDQVSGRTAEADVVIQVVSDTAYLLSYETVETPDALPANGIVHGDYDSDGAPEIMVSADAWVTGLSLAVYDHLGFGQLQEGFTLAEDYPNRGLVTGYINEDDYLDAVTCLNYEVWVLLGNGNGGFTVQDADIPKPAYAFIDAVLTDFNGDAYLDYVCLSTPSVVTIYAGGPGASFSQTYTFNAGASGLTLASQDLNGDGWDDLIVGTNIGLEVYLNNGVGAYGLSYSYTQNLGTYDIDITDQGSDFNGDGIYDLCVAAPGTGVNEGLSDLEVYLGQGDGSYNPVNIRVLYGTVSGNRAGDFNGDGLLDIAFINSTERYLGLLFGDSTGAFKNQLRFDIPKFQPRRMDCMDIDADGDLDVVVSSYEFNPLVLKSSLYVFLNGTNPSGTVNAPMNVDVIDNVDIEVIAPNGARLNKVSNSLASASLYRRNLNGNSCLDAEVSASTVNSGCYFLRVTPRPNLPSGLTFSLDYSVANGQTYQIARNLPAPLEQYVFPIFPDGQSPITPFQGESITADHPVFEWDSTGGPTIQAQSSLPFSDRTFNLRVASDPIFENLIETATIEGHSYTLQTALDAEEETPYYWQVRPSDQTDWGGIFVFHALPSGPTDVDDDDSDGTGQDGALPTEFALRQNYPNPFNPATGISYSLAHASHVRLEVFNVLGMLVTTLVDEYQGAGNYQTIWNANELSSGMYLYRLTTDEFSATKKMILLK